MCISGAGKLTNYALCDKSTNFGTDVDMYHNVYFQILGHRKSDLGVRHIDFKMAIVAIRKLAIFFGPDSTTNEKFVAKQPFSGQIN